MLEIREGLWTHTEGRMNYHIRAEYEDSKTYEDFQMGGDDLPHARERAEKRITIQKGPCTFNWRGAVVFVKKVS